MDDAELAQRLLARGLVRAEALEWLRAQQAHRDPRPLRRLVCEAGLIAPAVLQRLEAEGQARAGTATPGSGPGSRRAPLPEGPEQSRGNSSRSRRALEPGGELLLGGPLAVEVERLLGRGGMGEVYLVRDPALGRRAALKVVRGEALRTRVLRFQRETRITARLDHPGIPPVFQCGRTPEGADYLLMRYVDGRSLETVLADLHPGGEREPRDLLAALVKVAEAVGYAHAQGVVHRDLKPGNVMIGAFGEVLVMDWGLARDLRESAESDQALRQELLVGQAAGSEKDPAASGKLTQEGAVLGTPGYLAPEQAAGRDVDARADVFALGAILTEVLTGAPPCPGPGALEALGQVAAGRIASPRERRPDVAPELDAVARRALALEPGRRYASAQAFADDLRAWLEGRPVSVFRYGPLRRTLRLVRRNPGPFAVLGTSSVLGIVGAVLVTRAQAEGRIEVAQAREQAAASERAQALQRAREAAGAAWDEQTRAGGESPEERLRRAIAALQAAQAWRALAPAEREAATAQERAALVLGEEATRQEQWWLARHAYAQARGLSKDDGQVEAGLRRLEEARTAEARRREAEVQELLTRARQGELDSPAALREAEDRIARYPDPRTVELLVHALGEVTRLLVEARRETYRGLEQPTPEEARAGERPLPGLLDALETRSRAGIRQSHRTSRQVELQLAAAERRLLARQVRAAREGSQPLRSAREALALAQAHALGSGPLAAARLIVPALGRLGTVGSAGGVEALCAYLEAEEDEARAAEGGLALARLDPLAAREALLGLVLRFGSHGLVASRVSRVLGEAAPAVPPDATDRRTPAELMREAQQLELSGRVDEALALVDRALGARPDWPDGLCYRASLHLSREDPGRARTDLERARTLAPTHSGAWFLLGSVELLEGRWEAAERMFDRALGLGVPNRTSVLNNRALCRERQGDLAGALADLDQALALEPRNVALLAVRGPFRIQAGRLAEGREDLRRALELDPDQHAARFWLAQELEREGRAVEALRELDRAVEVAPRRADYLRARASVRDRMGDLPGALTDATRALELAPGELESMTQTGRLLLASGRAEDGMALLDRAVAAHPTRIRAWTSRARELLRRGEREKAQADLSSARALGPDDADELRGRAEVAQELGDLAAARADLEELLRRAPGDLHGRNHLGLLLWKQGERAAALAIYDRLVEDWPTAEVWANRALVAESLGRLEEARRSIDRAVELSPELARLRFMRGELRLGQEDAVGAEADLSEGLRLDPRHAGGWLLRARARRALGRPSEARADAARGLELDPDEDQKKALEELLAAQ